MQFKGRMQLEQGLRQIDIAPLIDMVFQLLIFFMLTSSFVVQPGIKVNLPKAITSKILEERDIHITVSAESVIYFNNQVFNIKELRSTLEGYIRQNKDVPVLIKADKRASLGRVVEIWDLCRELGITKVNIATTME